VILKDGEMKHFGKIVVCLGGGLVLNAGLMAQELSSTNHPLPDNPYASIVVRNVFGLNPPAAPPDSAAEAHQDLPKITPDGIMSIFGHLEVLFKTSGGDRPDLPARDKFYDLAEGQMQDEIKVSRIDAQNDLVTFNNHGVVQKLPLVSVTVADDDPNLGPAHFAGAHLRAGFGGPNPWRYGGPFNAVATDGNGPPAP
jgi:hypothetical protein